MTNVLELFDVGVLYVIVMSYVFRDGVLNEDVLSEMICVVGVDKFVFDLSCRLDDVDGRYKVVMDRW